MAEYKCRQCGTKFGKTSSCGCSCSNEELKCPKCGSVEFEETEDLAALSKLFKLFTVGGGGG